MESKPKMEHLQLNFALSQLDQIEDNYGVKGLFDLAIECQVQLLEFLKRLKDCEKGKARGKGFANCQAFNQKRNPRIFTYLEMEFSILAENFNVRLNHEVRFKSKDRLNRRHIFIMDFLEPTKRVNVEISPNWHKNYIIVNRRDVLRKKLLRKHGIRSLTVPVTQKCNKLHIDYSRARKILRHLESLTISSQSLDYYL